MRLRSLALALSLVCLVGAGACSTSSSRGPNGAATAVMPPTTLRVVNNGYLDMDVFAVRDAGQRIRLGTATGSSTTVLKIPADVLVGISTQLRFIADPIGGTRNSVSTSILVNPGDQVTLTIPPS